MSFILFAARRNAREACPQFSQCLIKAATWERTQANEQFRSNQVPPTPGDSEHQESLATSDLLHPRSRKPFQRFRKGDPESRRFSGQIVARDLPGRAKFLPQDIEAFLSASRKGASQRGR
jgi:hypothetical protein